MSYEKKILNVIEYYCYMYKHLGLKWMVGLTDSRYPRFLALGWCSYRKKEIVVCKSGNWELRLMHEIGHEIGMKILCRKDI